MTLAVSVGVYSWSFSAILHGYSFVVAGEVLRAGHEAPMLAHVRQGFRASRPTHLFVVAVDKSPPEQMLPVFWS